jgi:glutathione-regulated potassium-efflux system ancillary protein KefC
VNNHSFLFYGVVYLLATVIMVPIAKKLGLGAVLGYLIAGAIIGPWGLKFINNPETILHFAEFGVVLLMFLIGLELNPKRLWELRRPIFGAGTMQVALTSAAFFCVGKLLGLPWQAALVCGLGLSLSSTAIASQILSERALLSTDAGKSSFAVLLFQDIAVIPILAILPLLGAVQTVGTGEGDKISKLLPAVGAIVSIVLFGRFLTRPLFRTIANLHLRESFTAVSLLVVLGISMIMDAVGLSMALGTFLAGVILADSEYRHELEANIEPFKGLLLGLFFVSVGMNIDFGLLISKPIFIIYLVLGFVTLKFLLILGIGRILRLNFGDNFLFSTLISQGGEFAFVLFGAAFTQKIFDQETLAIANVTVALSMVATPFLLIFFDKVISPRMNIVPNRPADEIKHDRNTVVIAGLGRVGQIVARLLHANKINPTVIDHNPNLVDRTRKFGYVSFYGDATQPDLLHAAGLEHAKILVVAIDDREGALKIIEFVRRNYPKVIIVARAWDMIHVYDLLDHGVTEFERETFSAAVSMGERVLHQLGMTTYQARRMGLRFKHADEVMLQKFYEFRKDDTQIISTSRQAKEELEKLFEADELAFAKQRDDGWD